MVTRNTVKLLPPKGRAQKPIASKVLKPSISTYKVYSDEIDALVQEMTKEVRNELVDLFSSNKAEILDEPVAAMDEDFTGAVNRLMARFNERFKVMFDRAASPVTQRMVDRTLTNSETGLKSSLKEVSKHVTLNTGVLTDRLKVTVDASVSEAVGLIKRIPEKYLGDVQGDVMRSITTGNGLQDLIPAIDKRNVQVKNYATNVALDQTRKVYNNVTKGRMEAVGVKKFQWVHSGGSNQPREHHKLPFPAGLNGGIFSFDDLPIIDERTGERGIPGQLPYCGCTMRPIISFDVEEN